MCASNKAFFSRWKTLDCVDSLTSTVFLLLFQKLRKYIFNCVTWKFILTKRTNRTNKIPPPSPSLIGITRIEDNKEQIIYIWFSHILGKISHYSVKLIVHFTKSNHCFWHPLFLIKTGFRAFFNPLTPVVVLKRHVEWVFAIISYFNMCCDYSIVNHTMMPFVRNWKLQLSIAF